MGTVIERLDVFTVAVAHNAEFSNWGISNAPTASRDEIYVIVRIESNRGEKGYGEIGRYYEGETPWTAARVIKNYIAPRLVGQPVGNLGACRMALARSIDGQLYAKSAVEMALLDLAARSANIPVWQLLGGKYRSRIEICPSVGINEAPEEVAERTQSYFVRGFRDIKVKVGRDFDRDRRSLQMIRQVVGPEVGIRIDPNRAYGPEDALKKLGRLEEFDLSFIEQPVEPGDHATLRQLSGALETPIFADENTRRGDEVFNLARTGTVRGIMIKPARMGGVLSAIEVAHVANAAHLAVCVGSMRELGIATAACLHLAASLPRLPFASNLAGPALFLEDDVLKEKLVSENGAQAVPDGVGLGVEVDEEKLAFFSVPVE